MSGPQLSGRLIQSGNRTARIVFVGEAPGEREDATGLPFVGGAGFILDKLLESTGIRRSECFITNVCHTRPPANKFEWFYKKENQVHYIRGVLQLKRDLEAIRPNIVVALGNHPLQALTGKRGIDKWRGSILESTLVPGLKVVGTYHPAAILRIYDYYVVAKFDLKRVREQSDFPEIKRPFREHVLHPDPETRDRLVEEMCHAEWLGVDIETWMDSSTGLWKLACVGFSDRASRSLVIHNDGPGSILAIRRLCASPAKKVFQNGSFDVTVLADEGIEVTNFAWDTMLGHHALYPECASSEDEISAIVSPGKRKQAAIKKGLGFQTSIYTEEPYYKDDGKVWRETNDLKTFWLYNGRDTAVTREIRDVQEREIAAYGVEACFARRMRMIPPTLAATRRGIRIDLELRARLHSEIQSEIDRLQLFLDTAAGGPVNVKSSPDVRSLIYDKLKLPVKRKRGTGAVTADKDALIELGTKYANPVLHAILKIRERRDLIERYLTAKVDADGRIRCSFDITGTRTGRLSSRASIYGSGTNLQNIPSRRKVGEAIKRMFIADPGKVFILRDYSQAEVWIVAYLSRCQKLIDLLTDPTRDIHRETASGIYNKPIESITYDERYVAKRTVHSSNYGVGPKNLMDKVNEEEEVTGIRINMAQAQRAIDAYFMMYPEIKENFWREVEQELRYSRTLTTPLQMKRTFYGRADFTPQSKFLREAYSFIPQSTVGELGEIAWANAYEQIELARPETGTNVLLNVHDSLLVQADMGHCGAIVGHLEAAMAIPITINGVTFTIPTDAKVGLNWGKAGDDNPNGLRDWDKGGKEWLETQLSN